MDALSATSSLKPAAAAALLAALYPTQLLHPPPYPASLPVLSAAAVVKPQPTCPTKLPLLLAPPPLPSSSLRGRAHRLRRRPPGRCLLRRSTRRRREGCEAAPPGAPGDPGAGREHEGEGGEEGIGEWGILPESSGAGQDAGGKGEDSAGGVGDGGDRENLRRDEGGARGGHADESEDGAGTTAGDRRRGVEKAKGATEVIHAETCSFG